jgi:hypothetical protein
MGSCLALALIVPSTAALAAVFALAAAQVTHFRLRTGRWRALAVQVRIAFMLPLLAGCLPPLAFIHWMQLAGIAVRVAFDYCLLARTLSLMPWNRRSALDLALVRDTYLTPPSRWRPGFKSQQHTAVSLERASSHGVR